MAKNFPIERCQGCDGTGLASVLFLGFLPPVNSMAKIGTPLQEEPGYPAQLFRCRQCHLVQLGFVVDPEVLFPPTYPYSSGTTKILRQNFKDLHEECAGLLDLKPQDLIIDIGSNDGTLLENFRGHRVFGIEPTQMGEVARKKGIATLVHFFNAQAVRLAKEEVGKARVITATNVFAHIQNVHEVIQNVLDLLGEKGVFVTESHYLYSVIDGLQYDTVYHEHLRYYSLQSLIALFKRHEMEVFHVRKIPTHGGSIRVYAARRGEIPIRESVASLLREEERKPLTEESVREFRRRVSLSKLGLLSQLHALKERGKKICGVGAPSRASTLVHYVGLDEGMIDCIYEISGSHKIGKYMPGTLIPVVEESAMQKDAPDVLLLFSWHIAEELMEKIRTKGYRGDFLIPLPEPHRVEGKR